ncbi:MAG TPA: hypothetical protein VGB30_12775 [bacterium]
MTASNGKIEYKQWLIPLIVFAGVFLVHYIWIGTHPAEAELQSRWAPVDDVVEQSWMDRYIETKSFFLGYSYSLSLAFVSFAILKFIAFRENTARNAALGGITLTGFLAATGCFLIGCCGSPMLAVYASLLGASFLPFTGLIVAGITTLTIGFAYLWMNRRLQKCCDESCACNSEEKPVVLSEADPA